MIGRSLDWLELHQKAKAYGWRIVYHDASLPFERSDWLYIAISDDAYVVAMVPREMGMRMDG